MGEKKDLLISFCIALWATVLLFSMFYMPAIAAELTMEDEQVKGNYWGNGWVAKAYVKGWYYYDPDTGYTAKEFHHTYHESIAKVTWGWTIVDAVWDFKGKKGTSTIYHEDGHFEGKVYDYYYDYVDYARTYTWAHFKRWNQEVYTGDIIAHIVLGDWT